MIKEICLIPSPFRTDLFNHLGEIDSVNQYLYNF